MGAHTPLAYLNPGGVENASENPIDADREHEADEDADRGERDALPEQQTQTSLGSYDSALQ